MCIVIIFCGVLYAVRECVVVGVCYGIIFFENLQIIKQDYTRPGLSASLEIHKIFSGELHAADAETLQHFILKHWFLSVCRKKILLKGGDNECCKIRWRGGQPIIKVLKQLL